MAPKLGPRRIAVNVVAPGAIATDFSGRIVRDNPKVAKTLAPRTALGRICGPEDVGPVVAGLLSDEFGRVIRDGGDDELMALSGGCCSCAMCHVYVDVSP